MRTRISSYLCDIVSAPTILRKINRNFHKKAQQFGLPLDNGALFDIGMGKNDQPKTWVYNKDGQKKILTACH